MLKDYKNNVRGYCSVPCHAGQVVVVKHTLLVGSENILKWKRQQGRSDDSGMDIEKRLQAIAYQCRQLLDSSAVNIRLQCVEQAVCHPLLTVCALLLDGVSCSYGERAASQLYQQEHVRAVCDVVQQSRQVWHLPLAEHDLLILPLAMPTGLLGVALCLDVGVTNRQYLLQTSSFVARQLERSLSEACQHVLLHWRTLAEGHVANTMPDAQEQHAFISLVGHELRVPLTAIKGYAGLLQAYGSMGDIHRETPGEDRIIDEIAMSVEQQRHYLDMILAQTSHLEVLVKDLTDYTRLRLGQFVFRYDAVDIAHLCRHVAQIMQDQVAHLQSSHYVITCHIAQGLPPVWADTDRVQQVLMNLLENAVKYSPAGGNIDILVALAPTMYPVEQEQEGHECLPQKHGDSDCGMVSITICDQGIGISPHHQSVLFHPFSRIQQVGVSGVPGLGVGLYITRTLVEAMHGSVMLESAAGHGTRVTFTLPVVGDEGRAQ